MPRLLPFDRRLIMNDWLHSRRCPNHRGSPWLRCATGMSTPRSSSAQSRKQELARPCSVSGSWTEKHQSVQTDLGTSPSWSGLRQHWRRVAVTITADRNLAAADARFATIPGHRAPPSSSGCWSLRPWTGSSSAGARRPQARADRQPAPQARGAEGQPRSHNALPRSAAHQRAHSRPTEMYSRTSAGIRVDAVTCSAVFSVFLRSTGTVSPSSTCVPVRAPAIGQGVAKSAVKCFRHATVLQDRHRSSINLPPRRHG